MLKFKNTKKFRQDLKRMIKSGNTTDYDIAVENVHRKAKRLPAPRS